MLNSKLAIDYFLIINTKIFTARYLPKNQRKKWSAFEAKLIATNYKKLVQKLAHLASFTKHIF